MTDVGIRALKQNASEAVALAASGESLTVTDRGRPVALLTPIPSRRLDELTASGRARPPRVEGGLAQLPPPESSSGAVLSEVLAEMRDDERF